MKWYNQWMLDFILKSELGKNPEKGKLSGIFQTIQLYIEAHFPDNQSYQIQPHPHYLGNSAKTPGEFMCQCHRECAARLDDKKLGIRSEI